MIVSEQIRMWLDVWDFLSDSYETLVTVGYVIYDEVIV